MKTRLSLALVATVLAAAVLAGAGAAAPARAAQSPAAIARHVLGHAPRGLAALVVRSGVVRVAVDANYPPHSSIDPVDRRPAGFDVDVAKAVGALLGLDVRFTFPAWETIPANLQQHRYYDVSIGSMEITPALQKRVDFATPYYYMAAQVVVKRGGARVHGVQDLFGRTVGVGAGTPYNDFLRRYPRIAVKMYVTDADAFPDLRSGKINSSSRHARRRGTRSTPVSRSSSPEVPCFTRGGRSPSARARPTGSRCWTTPCTRCIATGPSRRCPGSGTTAAT